MTGYSESIKRVLRHPLLPLDKLSGCNILITGSTGLIGSALVEALMGNDDIDYNVYAVGRNAERAQMRFSSFWNNGRFHFLKHDVMMPFDMDINFHYIIHAASNASPNYFISNPVETIKSNVIGLCHLLDYGFNHCLKRLLFVSSGEIYGEGDGREFDESYVGYVNHILGRSCYPVSKRAAENLCIAYAEEYKVDTVIARPCHVYGPYFTENDNRAFAQFLRNARDNQDIVMKSSGEQLRSWCYIVDCVSALLFILLLGEKCQAYNIASRNSNCRIKDFASTVAKIGGRSLILESPTELERKGYNPVSQSVFSVQKLESLGWSSGFDIDSGIVQCMEVLKTSNS